MSGPLGVVQARPNIDKGELILFLFKLIYKK